MTDMRVVVEVPPDIAAMLSTGMQYSVSGLETTKPILTVDGATLSGHFIDLVGTDLIFDPEKAGAASKLHDAGFVAPSTKRLIFNHPVLPKQARPKKKAPAHVNGSSDPGPSNGARLDQKNP